MRTVGDELRRLSSTYPYYDPETGMMAFTAGGLKDEFGNSLLFVVLGGSDGSYTFRKLQFFERQEKDRYEWSDWFDENLDRIMSDAILPKMFMQSGVHWRHVRTIGFANAL